MLLVLSLGLFRRGRICLFGFLLGQFAGQPLHLLHQPLHPPGLQERRGRLRLRVLVVGRAVQRHQAGDLVLLVLLLVHPGPAAGLPGAQAAAIDLDGDHRRRRRHARLQLAAAVPGGLVIALPGQLAADRAGDALDLAGADLDAGQFQGDGGVGEGAQPCGGLNDLLQQPGAEAVAVQAQGGP